MEAAHSVDVKRVRQVTEAIIQVEDLMLWTDNDEVRAYLEAAAIRLRAARLVLAGGRRRAA